MPQPASSSVRGSLTRRLLDALLRGADRARPWRAGGVSAPPTLEPLEPRQLFSGSPHAGTPEVADDVAQVEAALFDLGGQGVGDHAGASFAS
ncbi:MAG: hypothetical protein AAGB29_03395, partial [Planctomycetota bacterium]